MEEKTVKFCGISSVEERFVYTEDVGSSTLSSRTIIGAIAQLGERLICIQEVCGSIPHGSTKNGWSRQIDPPEATVSFHSFAAVAQQVEQLICNHQVGSSILSCSTSLSQSGAVVARLVHTQKAGGAIPPSATIMAS